MNVIRRVSLVEKIPSVSTLKAVTNVHVKKVFSMMAIQAVNVGVLNYYFY